MELFWWKVHSTLISIKTIIVHWTNSVLWWRNLAIKLVEVCITTMSWTQLLTDFIVYLRNYTKFSFFNEKTTNNVECWTFSKVDISLFCCFTFVPICLCLSIGRNVYKIQAICLKWKFVKIWNIKNTHRHLGYFLRFHLKIFKVGYIWTSK